MPAVAIDAPDTIWAAAELIVDCPDTIWAAAELIVDCPDTINTSAFVTIDAPDTVSMVKIMVVDAPDTIVIGSITAAIHAGLNPPSGTQRHVQPLAWMRLTLNGTKVVYSSLNLSWGIKQGWRWSATLPANSIDIRVGETGLPQDFQITINDGMGFELTTPILRAKQRRKKDPRGNKAAGISLSGYDKTSYLLTIRNQSAPTFKNTNSVAILNQLAAPQSIVVQGAVLFPVPDEDMKQSLLSDAVQRFISVSAQEWYIDEQGRMILCNWSDTAGALEVDWSDVEQEIDPELRFTKIKLAKRSPRQGTTSQQGSFDFQFKDTGPKSFPLPNPLYNPIPSNRGTIGFADLIGFYDGDPTAKGVLIALWQFNQGLGLNVPTPTPTGKPATHVTCFVFNSNGQIQVSLPGLPANAVVVLLHITGTPANLQAQRQGTDPSFLYEYDSGITPAWPADDWVDSLFPTRQWAVDHGPDYLNLKNKGWDKLMMTAVCHANARLRQTFNYDSNVYKVDKINWKGGSTGAPTMDLELVRR